MKKYLLFTMALFTVVANSQNKLESFLTESYDGTIFENNYKTDFVYGVNNRLISETSYNWESGTTNWTESYKSSYLYLTDTIVKSILNETWNGVQFENEYMATFGYNSNKDIIGFLGEEWDSIQWNNAYKGSVTYSNNLISTIIFEEWDGTNWVNDEKNIRTYNGNNVTEELTESWNGTQWETESRKVFTHNSNNAITQIISETWNGTTWNVDETTTFELDSSGNRTKATNSGTGVQYKDEYNYDLMEQMTDYIHPFNDLTGVKYLNEDFPYVNKALSFNSFEYNTGTSSFEQKSKTTYNYNGTVGINDIEQTMDYEIFPNPTNEFIGISGLKGKTMIRIVNLLGEIVFQNEINNNEKINVTKLINGLYFLQIENGQTMKFVKE